MEKLGCVHQAPDREAEMTPVVGKVDYNIGSVVDHKIRTSVDPRCYDRVFDLVLGATEPVDDHLFMMVEDQIRKPR